MCVYVNMFFLFYLPIQKTKQNRCCVDVPRVQLQLGRNLESDHIREGIDVYFDCHVTARPSAVRLVWRHQVRSLGRPLNKTKQKKNVYLNERKSIVETRVVAALALYLPVFNVM